MLQRVTGMGVCNSAVRGETAGECAGRPAKSERGSLEMAYVFVSYAREDETFVTELNRKLRESGIDVWQDIHDIRAGEKWAVELDAALAGAGLLVLVLSTASAHSEYVTYEWAYASGARIPVLPLRISGEQFHPRIEMLQVVDFETQRPWDRLTREMLERMDVKLETIRQLSRALSSPREEERNAAELELLRFLKHPVARDELLRATKSGLADVREWAIARLAQERDARVVPALIDRFVRERWWEQASTITELERLVDESSGPQLIGLLTNENAELVELAVHLLSKVGSSMRPLLLAKWLSKVPLKERAAALRALGAVGARQLRDEATRLLIHSRTVELRIAAAEYLGRIGDTNDALTLMGVLKRESASECLRGTAAVALARMNHKVAIPVIVKLFNAGVAWKHMAEALLRFDTVETRAVVSEAERTEDRMFEAAPDDKGRELAAAYVEERFRQVKERAAR